MVTFKFFMTIGCCIAIMHAYFQLGNKDMLQRQRKNTRSDRP